MQIDMYAEKWNGTAGIAASNVIDLLHREIPVRARLDGPYHDTPGIVVDVQLSPCEDAYLLGSTDGWIVHRSGGGYWNPHTIIYGSRV